MLGVTTPYAAVNCERYELIRFFCQLLLDCIYIERKRIFSSDLEVVGDNPSWFSLFSINRFYLICQPSSVVTENSKQ